MLKLLVSALLVLPVAVAAEPDADLCTVRPDLCDSEPSAPGQSAQKRRMDGHRKARARAAEGKRKRRAVKGKLHLPCREPGDSYNTNYASLPLCDSEASFAAGEALDENARNPLLDAPPAPNPRAARTPAGAVNFDSYIRRNAKHPAFASRTADRQVAFQLNIRTTFSVPDVGNGGGMREDAPGPAAGGPPSGPATPPPADTPPSQPASFSGGY